MEGFAIASNTAGLLNLGLAMCHELLMYYKSCKGAEDDVKRIYSSTESLAKTFLCLKRSIQKGHLGAEVVTRVEDCIVACESALKGLQKKLEKIKNATQANPKWNQNLKWQFQRALYPFKESTIAKLKETCNGLQGELSISLHALQM